MAVYDMKSLLAHAHHAIECVTYGGRNSIQSVSLECMTCGEVLVSYDADEKTEYEKHSRLLNKLSEGLLSKYFEHTVDVDWDGLACVEEQLVAMEEGYV